jgi:hypothetical protein
MIHPYYWDHSLPCGQSDKISQVLVQSRTVRRAKASAYSTECQMFTCDESQRCRLWLSSLSFFFFFYVPFLFTKML